MDDDRNDPMRTPDALALGALVLATVASVAGVLASGLYRDVEEGIRQARATDVVTLILAVPALGLGLWRARTGSAAGRAVVVGALGYLAYSYAIYAFSVVINPMTPAHIAILGLATWSLMLMAFRIDDVTLHGAQRARLPRRITAGFLLIVAGLFALLWSGTIAGAISSGTLPAGVSDLGLPTSPVYALDIAFALPSLVLAGVWLLRLDRRGAAAALAALSFVVLMGSSVLVIFAMDASAGISLELPPALIFGLVTAIGAVLLGIGLRAPQASTSLRLHPA